MGKIEIESVYISIPMKGLDIHRQRLIANEISIVLKSKGYNVITPFEACKMIDKNLPENLLYAECMGKDISELLKCDAVYFCAGWDKSKGCMLEYWAAKLYNKKIIMQ
jgi:hypothetical protein